MTTPKWFEPKINAGTLLQLAVLICGLAAGWALVNDTATRTARAVETLSSVVAVQETRLSVLERRFDDGKSNRDRLQSATEQAISALRDDNAKILAQLAAIIARMDAKERPR